MRRGARWHQAAAGERCPDPSVAGARIAAAPGPALPPAQVSALGIKSSIGGRPRDSGDDKSKGHPKAAR